METVHALNAAAAPAAVLPPGRAGFLRGAAIAGFLLVLWGVAAVWLLQAEVLSPSLAFVLSQASLFLSLIWLSGVQAAQARATGRLGFAAYLLAAAGLLALSGVQIAAAASGTNLGALLGTRFGLPVKAVLIGLGWSSLLFGVVSMRGRVLPAGAMALLAMGLAQSLLGSRSGDLLAPVGIAWGSVALLRIAAARAAGPAEQAVAATGRRLLPLDVLRGLIMVLMALDHMRLFLVPHPMESWEAALPQYDSAGQFLSRFVTHLCAPGFFLLMGAGMILFADSRRRLGWSWGRIAGYWALRGLLLVAVEQILANPMMNGSFTPQFFGVLTGLGGAMVIGALFLRLDAAPLLALGAGITLADQVLPAAVRQLGLPLSPLVRFTLLPGATGNWFVAYSLFGWLGVTLLGMAFGRALLRYGDRVYRWALYTGVAGLLLFPLVRLAGGFGNIRPVEGTGWMGFLNVVKYPPSLALLLFALGVLGILLYLFNRAGPGLARWARPLAVIGQVALFFYVTHLMLYRMLQLMWVSGDRLVGVTLPTIYLGWLAGLILLYPLCLLYGQFKHTTPPGSLWRLF